jgi:hypothetical protein
VAGGAALVVDLAALGLLRVQAQLRVSFLGFIRPASGENGSDYQRDRACNWQEG